MATLEIRCTQCGAEPTLARCEDCRNEGMTFLCGHYHTAATVGLSAHGFTADLTCNSCEQARDERVGQDRRSTFGPADHEIESRNLDAAFPFVPAR
jgi:hypothetical protein